MNTGPIPKLLLGLLTAWPLLFVVGVFALDSEQASTASGATTAAPDFLTTHFGLFFVVAIGSMLLSLALLLFYIAHVLYSDLVPERWRIPWIVFLSLGGYVAMLVYWYRHIWRSSLQEIPASS